MSNPLVAYALITRNLRFLLREYLILDFCMNKPIYTKDHKFTFNLNNLIDYFQTEIQI